MLNNLAMVTFDFTKTEVYLCQQSSAVNQSHTKDHQKRCRSELTKVKISGSREIAFNQNKGREDLDFEKVTKHFLFLFRSICVSKVLVFSMPDQIVRSQKF